nr:MAG TPA: hypothetical protein [Caudoviricetes sp.]
MTSGSCRPLSPRGRLRDCADSEKKRFLIRLEPMANAIGSLFSAFMRLQRLSAERFDAAAESADAPEIFRQRCKIAVAADRAGLRGRFRRRGASVRLRLLRGDGGALIEVVPRHVLQLVPQRFPPRRVAETGVDVNGKCPVVVRERRAEHRRRQLYETDVIIRYSHACRAALRESSRRSPRPPAWRFWKGGTAPASPGGRAALPDTPSAPGRCSPAAPRARAGRSCPHGSNPPSFPADQTPARGCRIRTYSPSFWICRASLPAPPG